MIESLTPQEIQNLFDYECVEVEEESFEELTSRYNGFGSDFYRELSIKFPLVFQHLRFYKEVRGTGKCSGILNFPDLKVSHAHFLYRDSFVNPCVEPPEVQKKPEIAAPNFGVYNLRNYWAVALHIWGLCTMGIM